MVKTHGISNLVFEGGGVGAIAYAGFLAKAENDGLLFLKNIQRVVDFDLTNEQKAALLKSGQDATNQIMRETYEKSF